MDWLIVFRWHYLFRGKLLSKEAELEISYLHCLTNSKSLALTAARDAERRVDRRARLSRTTMSDDDPSPEVDGAGKLPLESSRLKNFLRLATPPHLRYQPGAPPKFGYLLNVRSFAVLANWSESVDWIGDRRYRLGKDLAYFSRWHAHGAREYSFASTFTVANLYYCQPLLSRSRYLQRFMRRYLLFPTVQLSLAFGVSYEAVSR